MLLVNLGDKLDDVLTLAVIMKEQKKQAVISLGMLHLTTTIPRYTAFLQSFPGVFANGFRVLIALQADRICGYHSTIGHMALATRT